ncbi:LON peptidase substrate-binding domain-containing protein [Hydrocarboniphaga effusa]|uniref:LON peptidase substrate-binding domain-containing protein n=1 Tax=Hydrocarboniphaga effusa TaxID=243629 RepID=UPI00398BD92F
MKDTAEIPIFPLNTVLYPQGVLPLRIFETRYVDMTKACIGNDEVFGVCLIREGREVGSPATPEIWGCTARIVQWEVPTPGLFSLVTHGERIFCIRERYTTPSGLTRALVQFAAPPDPQPVPARYRALVRLIENASLRVDPRVWAAPMRPDDAAWVAWRLAEWLPLPSAARLRLLELRDGAEMLALVDRHVGKA